ncbi:hypothetical protein AA309_01170 [Microvirga vignae]|uniref:Uncharacterized protein n=1 Tax=Microvirga vignae TaxID=1225564 RepID=A0A0H1RQB2_9HYPH|nr:hypothetical protein [Microvirga vignae]KLK94842.1 hypothetical protein AA309_01170 [Microvirga vignae]
MIVRSLLLAGAASGSLIAVSPAMAQYVPLGSLMNAVHASQPAPQPGMQAQQPQVQAKKPTRARGEKPGGKSKVGAPPPQYDVPRNNRPRYHGGPSDDNG